MSWSKTSSKDGRARVDAMSDDAFAGALDYLARHNVLTLATQGPAGLWAAAVFYASEQFSLYFLSAPDTRHVQNLRHHPWAAGTIQEDYADWKEIKGIQLEGAVHQLSGADREAAIASYEEKFAFLREAPPQMREALERVDWFRLRPDRLYFIDNSRGFGHRERIL